jgi:tRNA (guanine37-N1)-methyltransferase
MSGNHKAIASWRRQQALEKTRDRRPDLLKKAKLTAEDNVFLTSVRVSVAGAPGTSIEE